MQVYKSSAKKQQVLLCPLLWWVSWAVWNVWGSKCWLQNTVVHCVSVHLNTEFKVPPEEKLAWVLGQGQPALRGKPERLLCPVGAEPNFKK